MMFIAKKTLGIAITKEKRLLNEIISSSKWLSWSQKASNFVLALNECIARACNTVFHRTTTWLKSDGHDENSDENLDDTRTMQFFVCQLSYLWLCSFSKINTLRVRWRVRACVRAEVDPKIRRKFSRFCRKESEFRRNSVQFADFKMIETFFPIDCNFRVALKTLGGLNPVNLIMCNPGMDKSDTLILFWYQNQISMKKILIQMNVTAVGNPQQSSFFHPFFHWNSNSDSTYSRQFHIHFDWILLAVKS